MKAVTVDARGVAAAFLQEEYAEPARAVLTGRYVLRVPDLVYAELANVIWKYRTRGEVSEEEALALVTDLRSLPLLSTPCMALAEPALRLALQTGRTVYDCMYLALAVSSKAKMVTADRRLVNGLADTPLARHVVHLGDAF